MTCLEIFCCSSFTPVRWFLSSRCSDSPAIGDRLASPVGCTDTCLSRQLKEGGEPDGSRASAPGAAAAPRDPCDCSSCRLSRAIEEAARLLRPYGVSIVRDPRLLKLPGQAEEYPPRVDCTPRTPNAFLPLPPPSLPLTKAPSSPLAVAPSQLALVPYSSPSGEAALSALPPSVSSLSTCFSPCPSPSSVASFSSSSRTGLLHAAPVVGVLVRPKAAAPLPRQTQERQSDVPCSPASSSSCSFPPDIIHEVVRELKKGLTCFVLRGAPPVTPLPGVRTPAPPPVSSSSASKAISVSTTLKRGKVPKTGQPGRGDDLVQSKERSGGGNAAENSRDRYPASHPGWEGGRGTKSSFDEDSETLEGWIDAIIQLHDMEDEDRQTLVVTNHYAGIFGHKRAVITHTSHEFR